MTPAEQQYGQPQLSVEYSGNSRPVRSSQCGPHPGLQLLLKRRSNSGFQRPVAEFSRQAFLAAAEAVGAADVILDSGCGTGLSTLRLAELNPDHFVVGVDKSAARLSRGLNVLASAAAAPKNCCLIRADLSDVWRLAGAARWRIVQNYLLYPNPWPKRSQLSLRWHGHPVFPELLRLGGELIVRSNWRTYLEEAAIAARQVAGLDSSLSRPAAAQPLSPFERKYLSSGHDLWELRVPLSLVSASVSGT